MNDYPDFPEVEDNWLERCPEAMALVLAGIEQCKNGEVVEFKIDWSDITDIDLSDITDSE